MGCFWFYTFGIETANKLIKAEKEQILAFRQFSCTNRKSTGNKAKFTKINIIWKSKSLHFTRKTKSTIQTKKIKATEHTTKEDDTIKCEQHHGEKNKHNRWLFLPILLISFDYKTFSTLLGVTRV